MRVESNNNDGGCGAVEMEQSIGSPQQILSKLGLNLLIFVSSVKWLLLKLHVSSRVPFSSQLAWLVHWHKIRILLLKVCAIQKLPESRAKFEIWNTRKEENYKKGITKTDWSGIDNLLALNVTFPYPWTEFIGGVVGIDDASSSPIGSLSTVTEIDTQHLKQKSTDYVLTSIRASIHTSILSQRQEAASLRQVVLWHCQRWFSIWYMLTKLQS